MKIKNHKYCLIVLNGKIDKSIINKFLQHNSPRKSFLIIAADGAANTLFKYKIIPEYIIGDLDSISQKALNYFKSHKIEIKKIPEQEHNDFEKCILFALRNEYANIIVIGYGGKRIDHTINNFSILKKYSRKCAIKFIDNFFEIFFLNKKNFINYKKNELISLIALPKARAIKTWGMKYPLKNESLEFGVREGALNQSVSSEIKIEYKKGDILIIKKHFGKLKFN